MNLRPISISYSGTIIDTHLVPKLIHEVQDICTTMNWEYQIENYSLQLSPETNQKMGLADGEVLRVQGIRFKPHDECDWIPILVGKNGRLLTKNNDRIINLLEDDVWTYNIKITTLFGGPELHLKLSNLLRHLSKAYFKDFDLSDTANYLETLDDKMLEARFQEEGYNLTLDGGGLTNFERLLAEGLEKLIDALSSTIEYLERNQNSRTEEENKEGDEWKDLLK